MGNSNTAFYRGYLTEEEAEAELGRDRMKWAQSRLRQKSNNIDGYVNASGNSHQFNHQVDMIDYGFFSRLLISRFPKIPEPLLVRLWGAFTPDVDAPMEVDMFLLVCATALRECRRHKSLVRSTSEITPTLGSPVTVSSPTWNMSGNGQLNSPIRSSPLKRTSSTTAQSLPTMSSPTYTSTSTRRISRSSQAIPNRYFLFRVYRNDTDVIDRRTAEEVLTLAYGSHRTRLGSISEILDVSFGGSPLSHSHIPPVHNVSMYSPRNSSQFPHLSVTINSSNSPSTTRQQSSHQHHHETQRMIYKEFCQLTDSIFIWQEWIREVISVFFEPLPENLMAFYQNLNSPMEVKKFKEKYRLSDSTVDELYCLFSDKCNTHQNSQLELSLSTWLAWVASPISFDGKSNDIKHQHLQYPNSPYRHQESTWGNGSMTGFLNPAVATLIFLCRIGPYKPTWRFLDFLSFTCTFSLGSTDAKIRFFASLLSNDSHDALKHIHTPVLLPNEPDEISRGCKVDTGHSEHGVGHLHAIREWITQLQSAASSKRALLEYLCTVDPQTWRVLQSIGWKKSELVVENCETVHTSSSSDSQNNSISSSSNGSTTLVFDSHTLLLLLLWSSSVSIHASHISLPAFTFTTVDDVQYECTPQGLRCMAQTYAVWMETSSLSVPQSPVRSHSSHVEHLKSSSRNTTHKDISRENYERLDSVLHQSIDQFVAIGDCCVVANCLFGMKPHDPRLQLTYIERLCRQHHARMNNKDSLRFESALKRDGVGGNASFLRWYATYAHRDIGTAGTKWALVRLEWWMAWINSCTSKDAPRPPPLDNDRLLSPNSEALISNLYAGIDYIIIPPAAFSALVSWHAGGPSIIRTVINWVTPTSHAGQMQYHHSLEIYPLNLSFYRCNDSGTIINQPLVRLISQQASIAAVLAELASEYNIDVNCLRLWNYASQQWQHQCVLDPNHTFAEAGITSDQAILCEVSLSDGTWPRSLLQSSLYLRNRDADEYKDARSSHSPIARSQSTIANIPLYSADCDDDQHSTSYNNRPNSQISPNCHHNELSINDNLSLACDSYTPTPYNTNNGLVGLDNLGNSCYLNAVLQILIHLPVFRDYFLGGHHLPLINTPSSSSSGGSTLSDTLAKFIQKLWTTKHSFVVLDSRFVWAMNRLHAQFSGNEQQDAHEWLICFLEGLSNELSASVTRSSFLQPHPSSRISLRSSRSHFNSNSHSSSASYDSWLPPLSGDPFNGGSTSLGSLSTLSSTVDTGHLHVVNIAESITCDTFEDAANIHGPSNTGLSMNSDSSDDAKASLAWNNLLRTDRSIIQALFTGQFYSRITCSQCSYSSSIYEPFTSVSLPIPDIVSTSIMVWFIPEALTAAVKLNITLCNTTTTLQEVSEAIQRHIGYAPPASTKFVVARIRNTRIEAFLELHDTVATVPENSIIAIFEVLETSPTLSATPNGVDVCTNPHSPGEQYQWSPPRQTNGDVLPEPTDQVNNSRVSPAIDQRDKSEQWHESTMPMPPKLAINGNPRRHSHKSASRIAAPAIRDRLRISVSLRTMNYSDGTFTGMGGYGSFRMEPFGLPIVLMLPNTSRGIRASQLYDLVENRIKPFYKTTVSDYSARTARSSSLSAMAMATSGTSHTGVVNSSITGTRAGSVFHRRTKRAQAFWRDDSNLFTSEDVELLSPFEALADTLTHIAPSTTEDIAVGPLPRRGFTLRHVTSYCQEDRDKPSSCSRCDWLGRCTGCIIPDCDEVVVSIDDGETISADFHWEIYTDVLNTEATSIHSLKVVSPTAPRVTNNGSANGVASPKSTTSEASHALKGSIKQSKPVTQKNRTVANANDYLSVNGLQGSVPLSACFEKFGENEQIDGARCSCCNARKSLHKQISLWRLPPVLIIHLKRFQSDNSGRRKLLTTVDFPSSDLDIRPYLPSGANKSETIYNLHGVINHVGGLSGGHYSATVRTQRGTQVTKKKSPVPPMSPPPQSLANAASSISPTRSPICRSYLTRTTESSSTPDDIDLDSAHSSDAYSPVQFLGTYSSRSPHRHTASATCSTPNLSTSATTNNSQQPVDIAPVWHHFNDILVSRVDSHSSIPQNSPYILVYVRQDIDNENESRQALTQLLRECNLSLSMPGPVATPVSPTSVVPPVGTQCNTPQPPRSSSRRKSKHSSTVNGESINSHRNERVVDIPFLSPHNVNGSHSNSTNSGDRSNLYLDKDQTPTPPPSSRRHSQPHVTFASPPNRKIQRGWDASLASPPIGKVVPNISKNNIEEENDSFSSLSSASAVRQWTRSFSGPTTHRNHPPESDESCRIM